MATLQANEGHWLYNGESFAKKVLTFGDTSQWRDVTDEEKAEIEALMAEQPITELTIEERLDALEGKYTELYNQVGKLIQTTEGDGSAMNPYKYWKVGKSVTEGDWWMTDDGYLWQAIKTGTPSSSTDREYWDVVGLD